MTNQVGIYRMQLITGGMGFIGIHTTRALLDLGESCVLTTNSGTTRGTDLIGAEIGRRVFVEQLNVDDLAAILNLRRRHAITGVIHLSGASWLGSAELMRANAVQLTNVLRAAEVWGLKRVSLASTIGVYVGAMASGGLFREDMPLPMSAPHPIPAFKKVAEILGQTVGAAGGFEVISFRFGAWGPLFHHPPSPVSIFPQLAQAAVQGRSLDASQPQSRAFAEDGSDLCYVKDCARGIALLQMTERLNHRIYNIGNGRPITNQEFAAALQKAVPEAKIELPAGFDPLGFGRPAGLDITRLREDTGFEPLYDLASGVADYVDWLRAGHEY